MSIDVVRDINLAECPLSLSAFGLGAEEALVVTGDKDGRFQMAQVEKRRGPGVFMRYRQFLAADATEHGLIGGIELAEIVVVRRCPNDLDKAITVVANDIARSRPGPFCGARLHLIDMRAVALSRN